MPVELSLVLSPREASDPVYYLPEVARRLSVKQSQIAYVRVVRRSIDARGRAVRVNLGVQVYVDGEQAPPEIHFDYPYVGGATPVVVVGSGPAGLFAALRLNGGIVRSYLSAGKMFRHGNGILPASIATVRLIPIRTMRLERVVPEPFRMGNFLSDRKNGAISGRLSRFSGFMEPTNRSCTMRVRTSGPIGCRELFQPCGGRLPKREERSFSEQKFRACVSSRGG